MNISSPAVSRSLSLHRLAANAVHLEQSLSEDTHAPPARANLEDWLARMEARIAAKTC